MGEFSKKPTIFVIVEDSEVETVAFNCDPRINVVDLDCIYDLSVEELDILLHDLNEQDDIAGSLERVTAIVKSTLEDLKADLDEFDEEFGDDDDEEDEEDLDLDFDDEDDYEDEPIAAEDCV